MSIATCSLPTNWSKRHIHRSFLYVDEAINSLLTCLVLHFIDNLMSIQKVFLPCKAQNQTMNSHLQLSSVEIQMMQEVFAVMNKYQQKTRQFGINLIHSHFPMQENEILYETHNKEKRTLHVTPKKINDFISLPLATAWHQTEKGETIVSMFCCDDDPGGDNGSEWPN